MSVSRLVSRTSPVALLVAAGVLLTSPPTFAHGGTYLGPGDTVPPGGGGGGGGGGGPAGPAGPGGAAGPAGPDTGPVGVGGLPGSGGEGANGSASAAITGGLELGPDLDVWSFWWDFNKAKYLALKTQLYSNKARTGDGDWFLGEGETDAAPDVRRPSDAQIRDVVVPALLRALERETSNDIVTGCLIALAKVGDVVREDGGSELESVLAGFLDDGNQEIAETAALSLGILGRDTSVPSLVALLEDSAEARRLVGKSSVPERTRAFAAYGLGLVGSRTASEDVRRTIVEALARQIARTDHPTNDVPVAAVVSFGLVPLAELGDPGQEQPAVAGLVHQLDLLMGVFEGDADPALRTHAPGAVANLVSGLRGDRREVAVSRVVPPLLEYLSLRTGTVSMVEQGAILALGGLGDTDPGGVDGEIRAVLTKHASRSAHAQTRNFALVALAQTGARVGSTEPGEGRIAVADHLLRTLKTAKGSTRDWAALSLGVLANAFDAQEVDDSVLQSALRRELDDARSPDQVGVLSVAAGLAGDSEALPILREQLDRTRVDEVRGFVAVAMGMLDDRAAIEPITAVVTESQYRPELLKQAAIALGLLGDKTIVGRLADMLTEAKSLASQASIATALGFIGDRDSIEPLVEMLEDDGLTERARGFAAAALGIVADTDLLPWNFPISEDLNYRAAPLTLNANSAGTGVLNIL